MYTILIHILLRDYGMKININKTKTMVIGRKPKKIGMRIKDESFKQLDRFKYLGCNISSNMNFCQEIEQRIAMAKETFNRKRSIFCRSLEKELRKTLVKCFVWSVVLYGTETWTLRRNEQKRMEALEMWVWRRMERVKWTDKYTIWFESNRYKFYFSCKLKKTSNMII